MISFVLILVLALSGLCLGEPLVSNAPSGGNTESSASEESEVSYHYPVNISPAGELSSQIETTQESDGTRIFSWIGRLYLSQRQDNGGLMEIEADNAIVWASQEAYERYEQSRKEAGIKDEGDFLSSGAIQAIYVCGDVVMTEGRRTISCEELYYDFVGQKALIVEAQMRTYDVGRRIPIYVRAQRLRRVSENQFSAEGVVITSSEFYEPQISASVKKILITETTSSDERDGHLSDRSLDAQMSDVRLKYKDTTLFYWPFLRSNLERPELPIKSINAGYDSEYGSVLESRWYLWRILGLREPEGTEGTFGVDYYGKRGVGAGVDIEYAREDYFGQLLGYIINDQGEDDLGRDDSRRNVKPPQELRGRFHWQHRHFLPYDWQLTSEVSYLSDKHFLESFYRGEFNVGKPQETLVHLKRIDDNWGFSILGKGQINRFVDELEELPSVEYHLTGESIFDDRFTLYSDNQWSRFRNRLSADTPGVSEEQFTFGYHRTEVDMPLFLGKARVVPFVAGTFGYDDGMGFRTNIDGMGVESRERVYSGELGVRASNQYWKVYRNVKSKFWDLDQLRHVVRPYVSAVGYGHSDSAIKQRDTLSVGLSQRFQTKRGGSDDNGKLKYGKAVPEQRVVDWMRFDMAFTWVEDTGKASTAAPDRYLWNKPFIPLVDTYSTMVPVRDRRSSEI
ncbi:MAG: LPS-assembly protein LptD, partial [Planctomycetota bacterium]